MDTNELATKLLMFLACGGTVEHLIAEAPLSKEQIDLAFDRLQRGGKCSASDVVSRARQLREFVVRKHNAIARQEFELAASERAQELAVYQSFS